MLMFTPCGCGQYFQLFGGTFCLHLQGRSECDDWDSVYIVPVGLSECTLKHTQTHWSYTFRSWRRKQHVSPKPLQRCQHPRTKLTSKSVTLIPLNQWYMLMEWLSCVCLSPPPITFEPPDEFSWNWAWKSWQWSPSIFLLLNSYI
jgi:hypothetical protein